MGNEVQKFDPSKMMDGVKDRIKATFVGLIPDEAWDAMVKKEIDSFFDPQEFTIQITEASSNWAPRKLIVDYKGKASPFRQIVWQMCLEKSFEFVKKYYTDEYFGNHWPITEENMKETLKAVVKESAPDSMLKFFETIAFNAMNDLRTQILNRQL